MKKLFLFTITILQISCDTKEDLSISSCVSVMDISDLKPNSINITFKSSVFDKCGNLVNYSKLNHLNNEFQVEPLIDSIWYHFEDKENLGKLMVDIQDSTVFEIDLNNLVKIYNLSLGEGYGVFLRKNENSEIQALIQKINGDCNDLLISKEKLQLENIPTSFDCSD